MSKEWSTPFNSFNSLKALLWKPHLEGYANNNYLPPVSVDVDPSNRCNFKCVFCNAFDMIHDNEPTDQTEEHLMKISDFVKEWGTKSICVAGGGEPLMSDGTMGFLERNKKNGLETGLITNASLFTDEKINIIANTCRWVGISVDAATSETYNLIKGLSQSCDIFTKVRENIRKLGDIVRNTSTDLCMKFLIHPVNCNELYDAARLAKSIWCKGIHIRPCGLDNITVTKEKKLSLAEYSAVVDEQMAKAFTLEDDNFRVFGIRHKFNPDFTPLRKFSRCWSIPMTPTFGADGNMHCCFDRRGCKELIMCKHNPNPWDVLKWWNTPEHHAFVKNIDIEKCPRCTFSVMNEIVEKVIIKDDMYRNFP